MTCKITFSDIVDLGPTLHRCITVELLEDRVAVRLENYNYMDPHHPADQAGGEILLDTMLDVEALSVLFATEQVQVFKALVQLLGRAYNMKCAMP